MRTRSIIGIIALAILSGCASSKITDSFSSGESAEQFQQVVVLALVPSGNAQLRERLETHMADDLCQIGYYTLSALDAYGPDAFCGLCEQEMLEKLKRDKVDAIVAIALVGTEREKEYIAPKTPRIFYDYQKQISADIEQEGYYATRTFYYWETNVYRVRDQKLLYSARTETVDPKFSDRFAHDYGRLILDDMVRKGVFIKPIQPNPFVQ